MAKRGQARARCRAPRPRGWAGAAHAAARVCAVTVVLQLGLALSAQVTKGVRNAGLRGPSSESDPYYAYMEGLALRVAETAPEPAAKPAPKPEGGGKGGGAEPEKGAAEHEGGHVKVNGSMAISIMLLGAIGFQMTLFYLVNWDDKDIRYYSWQVIGDTISIFSAVLLFGAINGVVEAYAIEPLKESSHPWVIIYEKELEIGIDSAQMVFFFIVMQIATATFSGACCRGKGHGAQESNYGTLESPMSPQLAYAKKQEEEREHHELEEYREMNLKCFATMLAHMTGFAAINAASTLQHYGWFARSPPCALAACGATFLILVVILLITNCIRECYSTGCSNPFGKAQDEIDEWERLWDDECEEAENDVIALCISFLLTQVLRYWIFEELPDEEGVLKHKPSTHHIFWLLGSFVIFFLVFLIMMQINRKANEWAKLKYEKVHAGDSKFLRSSQVLLQISMMCFAWTGMWLARAGVQRSDWFNMEAPLTTVVIALVVSAFSFVLIFILDKIADSEATGTEVDKAVFSIIASIGLVVGFCWEKSFDKAVEEIAEIVEEPGKKALLELGLAIGLCVIVVPAYRRFILPKIEDTKRKHDELLIAKGHEDAASWDGKGGYDDRGDHFEVGQRARFEQMITHDELGLKICPGDEFLITRVPGEDEDSPCEILLLPQEGSDEDILLDLRPDWAMPVAPNAEDMLGGPYGFGIGHQKADAKGARVCFISPWGPAATAGVRYGDFINTINDVIVSESRLTRSKLKVRLEAAAVAEMATGAPLKLGLGRAGGAIDVYVPLHSATSRHHIDVPAAASTDPSAPRQRRRSVVAEWSGPGQ